MADQIGTLFAQVVADQAGFRSDMAAMARTVQSTTAQMNANLAKIGKASDALSGSFRLVTRVAAAFGVALSARALLQFTSQSINAAAELQNLSVRLNASVESLSELQYVARLTDVDFQSFTQSLQIMTRNFGEAAKGTKSMQDTFAQLGLDFRMLSTLSVDQQLEAVAEALNRVGNESQRTALAQEVFGRSGTAMLQSLEGGAEGLRRMRQEARDLGAVMSGETARAADEAKDAIDRLKAALSPLINELVNRLAPVLTTVAEKLREAFFPTEAEAALKAAKQELAEQGRLYDEARAKLAAYQAALAQHPQSIEKSQAEELERLTHRVSVFRSQVMDAQFALDALLSGQAATGGAPPAVVPGLVAPPSFMGNDFFGGGPADKSQQDFADAVREQEEEKTAIMQEELDKQLQAATDAAEDRLDVLQQAADAEIAMRQNVTNAAVGLLSALGAKHRGAAIAALLITKAMAVKEILINAQRAATLAYASQLIPGDPSSIVRAQAAYAKTLAMGRVSAGLVAATGLVEAAQLSSGGVQSTLGTTANPLNTRSSSMSTTGPAVVPHKRDVTEIHFHGAVYGWDDYVERQVIDGIRSAMVDRDVVLFTSDSRQGQMLGAAV